MQRSCLAALAAVLVTAVSSPSRAQSNPQPIDCAADSHWYFPLFISSDPAPGGIAWILALRDPYAPLSNDRFTFPFYADCRIAGFTVDTPDGFGDGLLFAKGVVLEIYRASDLQDAFDHNTECVPAVPRNRCAWQNLRRKRRIAVGLGDLATTLGAHSWGAVTGRLMVERNPATLEPLPALAPGHFSWVEEDISGADGSLTQRILRNRLTW